MVRFTLRYQNETFLKVYTWFETEDWKVLDPHRIVGLSVEKRLDWKTHIGLDMGKRFGDEMKVHPSFR